MTSLAPWSGRGLFDPFSTDIWDPWDIRLDTLWDTGGRRRGAGRDETTAVSRTNTDWRETENAHIFTVDLPGVRKDEVKVELEEGNVLRISGEWKKEEEQTTDTWHRVERKRGRFARRFRLPENVNLEEIKCSLENGLLQITVPKKETSGQQQNVRTITIG
ncbi:16.9 kDa class I heat shock protein 1-like [Nymphaea colorata]|nr:16.9 kDa class I heat shock protein 1-like [Nymphaea colorata]